MTTYDQNFYDTIRSGVQSSAAVVVPIVNELINPVSVVDFGAGEGWWAGEFAKHGCTSWAIDHDGARSPHRAPDVEFIEHDLVAQPVVFGGTADLVVCLEVAEHLPASQAVDFIADLVSSQPRAILFSAAIPGQPGAGHINCQWQSYWAALIEAHGYKVSGGLRREIWTDQRVEPWYRQNLLLGLRYSGHLKGKLHTVMNDPWPLDIVHPEIWGWFR